MKKSAFAGPLTLGLAAIVLTTSVFADCRTVEAASSGSTDNTYIKDGEFIPVKIRKAAEKAAKKEGKKGASTFMSSARPTPTKRRIPPRPRIPARTGLRPSPIRS